LTSRGVVIVAFTGLVLLVPRGVAADPATGSARRALRAGLEADLRQDPAIPGEAVAVSAPGLHLAVAVGRGDVAGGTPLEPDTPFRVASITKTFVAAAVVRLVETGKVELDVPIARYLSPESRSVLESGGYDPGHITVRQLLQHTAGLFDYATTDEYDHINETDPGHHWTPAEQLRFAMEHGRPVAKPGAKYHYSDTGYVLLGEILERATGESLAAAVRGLLHFDRIGLTDTYWEQLEPMPPGAGPRAHQYYDTFDNIGLDASHDLYGGGGLVSTVADLTKFSRALFRGKVFDDPHSLATMEKVSGPGRKAGAAMGLFALDVAGEHCYSHPGYWGSESTYCPRLDLAFARTINQADDAGFDYQRLERVIVQLARRARDK
jgi:D-alanyl-D-alanine carboxypeptidase